jgi:hypothetical protein
LAVIDDPSEDLVEKGPRCDNCELTNGPPLGQHGEPSKTERARSYRLVAFLFLDAGAGSANGAKSALCHVVVASD